VKLAKIFISLAITALGFGGLVAALEGSYSLSGFFLIAAIFSEWFRKVLIPNSEDLFSRLLYGGWIIWFAGVTAILLWKLFFSEYGVLGAATVFIFITAALVWHSRNIKREMGDEKYKGLYLPAGSGLIVSAVMWILKSGGEYIEYCQSMAVFVLLVSFLMVTDVEYFNFRALFRKKTILVLAAGAGLACGLVLWTLYALTAVFTVYMLSGLFREVRIRWKR
jgi:phosphatidylserine synthase